MGGTKGIGHNDGAYLIFYLVITRQGMEGERERERGVMVAVL